MEWVEVVRSVFVQGDVYYLSLFRILASAEEVTGNFLPPPNLIP